MYAKYIILILLLTCACGIVHGAEGETGQEQDLIKSAETAKESVHEAISEMRNAFDATKRALNVTLNAFSDIWNTANHAITSVQATLEAVQAHIGENAHDNDNITEIEEQILMEANNTQLF